MPLAPINPNNTQRYWVDYTTCGEQHSLQCRAVSTVTDADAGATMAAFLNAVSVWTRLITIDGFRRAAPGSNVTTSVTWPGSATYGSGAGSHYETAQYVDFIGRGPTGRRVRASVFGVNFSSLGGDYRISSAESPAVAAAIAELTSDAEIFVDVEYEIPVWHPYANCGVNAYWRNKVR